MMEKVVGRKFVSVDPSNCIGCGICEYVCVLEKKEPLWNPLRSRVRVIHFSPLFNAAMACRFCEDAPCVRACTRKALTQSLKGGVILVDESKCDGCNWCVQACPYGGITLHPDKTSVLVCDLCGGEPKCVEFCPEEALEVVSDDEAADKKWRSAIENAFKETEKIAEAFKKREWSSVFKEAEERAKRISEKLEEINKKWSVRSKF